MATKQNRTPANINNDPVPFFSQLGWQDWLYTIVLMASTIFAYAKYSQFMDIYETTFLFGAGIVFSVLGWCWKPFRLLLVGIAALSLFSINLYQGDLESVNRVFFLKFLIGSQTAVMWMNVLFVLAMLTYWFALFARSAFTGKVATSLTWAAVLMGFVGLMVRWYES